MLALVPNPPPSQAQEPGPRKTDYPASEYSVLVHQGHGLSVPAVTHRSPQEGRNGPSSPAEEPPQQETRSAAALGILPLREGTETVWDRDGAIRSGPPAARGEAMLPASSQASCGPRNRAPTKRLISETGKQHQIHGGSESAKIRGVTPARSRISEVCGMPGQGTGKPEASAGLGCSVGRAPCPSCGRTPGYYTPRLSTAQGRARKNELFLF